MVRAHFGGRISGQSSAGRKLACMAAGAGASLLLSAQAFAGVAYTSTTDSSWFNPANWSNGSGATATNAGPTSSDADIFNGQGYTSLSPNGVIFDPATDPNYSTTFQATAPANPTTVDTTAYTTIPQLYIAGGSGSGATTISDLAGKLTIRSGTLTVNAGSTGAAIGRPQLSGNPAGTTERAQLTMTGGALAITANNGDLQVGGGQTTGSLLPFGQNNTLDYTNAASITSTAKPAGGLRTNVQAGATGTTSNATLILRHTAAGTGALSFNSVILNASSATVGTENTTVEFHYGGGNVDTVNVGAGTAGTASLKITRGTTTGGGTANSYLTLVLDSAPTVTGGVVQSLGLFDVQNGATGIALGSVSGGTAGFNGLAEGATVSATFGGNTYNWTLYYDGLINGNTITGAGTGTDVVLVGQQFVSAPEPATLAALAMAGGLSIVRRRRA